MSEKPKDPIKPTVTGVVVRMHPELGVQIGTQLRTIRTPGYDTFYDGTQEACCETLKLKVDADGNKIPGHPREQYLEALARGLWEEIRIELKDILQIIPVPADEISWATTLKSDWIKAFPTGGTMNTEIAKGPQPWIGPSYIVQLRSEKEPQPDNYETTRFTWWAPAHLEHELTVNPTNICGRDLPVFLKVCELIRTSHLGLL